MPKVPLKLPDIDPAKLPYSRNAILGLPDSGKTVTAKKIAEHMMTAGVPITVFDPSGVWRFLRVPGKGRGFPVVVVGGAEPDLPMNDPKQAADIMRAVMASGVSVVFDLYDTRWSKENWKQIVEAAVHVLWYENKPFGLRHIFIEEAAEFIPQNFSSSDPHAGKLYANIEKIARMGRNAYLGMTLINQRAEGVNKAVLELCSNLLLHRQKGRNSLKNLSKWLEYIEGDVGEGIITSMPTLPTGECWAWTENRAQPEHIKIPMVESYHPNVAEALGAAEVKAAARKAVKVDEFVAKLREALPKIEAEGKANDPAVLRKEVARLAGELKRAQAVQVDHKDADGAGLEAARTARAQEVAISAAKLEGLREGFADAISALRTTVAGVLDGTADAVLKAVSVEMNARTAAVERAFGAAKPPKRQAIAALTVAPSRAPAALTGPPRRASVALAGAGAGGSRLPKTNGGGGTDDDFTTPQRRILASLAFWRSIDHDTPTREQVAAVAGYRPGSGNFNNLIGGLSSAGHTAVPAPGRLSLVADYPGLTQDEAQAKLWSIFKNPQARLVKAALEASNDLSRDELATNAGYAPSSGNFNNICGSLTSMDVLQRTGQGRVGISDWARMVLT